MKDVKPEKTPIEVIEKINKQRIKDLFDKKIDAFLDSRIFLLLCILLGLIIYFFISRIN